MLLLPPKCIVLSVTTDVWAVYCFLCVQYTCVCVSVCLFMHEWVMVTGLLVRQALWHYDRMRSPHYRMTRSPCQPLFRVHTHLTMSLNKSAWIIVMPLAVKLCPSLKHTHKQRRESLHRCTKQWYGYAGVLAESRFRKSFLGIFVSLKLLPHYVPCQKNFFSEERTVKEKSHFPRLV